MSLVAIVGHIQAANTPEANAWSIDTQSFDVARLLEKIAVTHVADVNNVRQPGNNQPALYRMDLTNKAQITPEYKTANTISVALLVVPILVAAK